MAAVLVVRAFAAFMACSEIAPAPAQTDPVDAELYRLMTGDWEFQKQHSPALAQFAQDRRWLDAWPDTSRTAIKMFQRHDESTLRLLRRIRQARLSQTAQLDYQLFERDLLNRSEEMRLKAYLSHYWQFERFGPSALRLAQLHRTARARPTSPVAAASVSITRSKSHSRPSVARR